MQLGWIHGNLINIAREWIWKVEGKIDQMGEDGDDDYRGLGYT